MTDHIRTVLPGLSDHQYEQRNKLVVARTYASSRMVQNTPPYHAVQQYMMVGEVVNAWLFAAMDDETLVRLVDYCRLLIKAGHEAEWLFNDAEGRVDNGIA